ncbi:nudC domain-containing protein 3 isoform X2 [Nylanderia fulva]|uniref:nudC domain-containing protein 3 isoform X2 n=1 Tax=Nylanderia fulva TaxID=613905 RepID=UPI0010FAFFA8|nr:nudC domain-containing protein 3 isoform X2 [Nylanderia fulva]
MYDVLAINETQLFPRTSADSCQLIEVFILNTDFYVESNLEQKLGFPSGVVEKLVSNSMYKWKNIASNLQKTISVKDSNNSSSISQSNQLTLTDKIENWKLPSVVQEIEIGSCSESTNIINLPSTQSFKTDHMSDSYNGAVRDNYVWTQTLTDLDVIVKIPEHIKTSKNTIKVNISSDKIKIDVKPLNSSTNSEWDNIFNDKLSFKIRKDESIWSVEAGKHINIHLEKVTERWWEALIIDEPKIDLSKIDCSKHFDDMIPEEQMNVQKLMWNQQQKLLNKSTFEQIELETILKQA